MSKYNEIANICAIKAVSFFEEKEKCKNFSKALVIAYKEYISAPTDCVSFGKVDDNNIKIVVSDEPLMSFPELVYGDNGYWYFSISVDYAEGKHGIKDNLMIGVAVEKEGFNVSFEGGDVSFVNSEESHASLLQKIYLITLSNINNINRPSRKIGFT